MNDVDPSGDGERVLEAPERFVRADRMAVRALVSQLAEQVQMIEDDLGSGVAEQSLVEQVVQVGVVRFGKMLHVVQSVDHVLGKGTQFHGRALWIGVPVFFGQRGDVDERGGPGAQEFEVGRGHQRLKPPRAATLLRTSSFILTNVTNDTQP